MCDIVIAADYVTFEDTAHFANGSIAPRRRHHLM